MGWKHNGIVYNSAMSNLLLITVALEETGRNAKGTSSLGVPLLLVLESGSKEGRSISVVSAFSPSAIRLPVSHLPVLQAMIKWRRSPMRSMTLAIACYRCARGCRGAGAWS